MGRSVPVQVKVSFGLGENRVLLLWVSGVGCRVRVGLGENSGLCISTSFEHISSFES